MTEDLLSQLANPKKNSFGETERKEEKPVQNISEPEVKPVEVKEDKQLEDRKKVEDIFKSIINNDRKKK